MRSNSNNYFSLTRILICGVCDYLAEKKDGSESECKVRQYFHSEKKTKCSVESPSHLSSSVSCWPVAGVASIVFC